MDNIERGLLQGYLNATQALVETMLKVKPTENYHAIVIILHDLIIENINTLENLSDESLNSRDKILHTLGKFKTDLDWMQGFPYTTTEGIQFKRMYAKDFCENKLDGYIQPILNFIEDVETEIK